MRLLRQLAPGLLTAAVSILLLLGGFTLSFVEGQVAPPLPPTDPTPSVTATLPNPPVITDTPIILDPSPSAVTITLEFTPTPSRTPLASTLCPQPAGWNVYVVRAGETIASLALRYKVTADVLRQANCLGTGATILTGSTLYVPPAPTRTPVPCGSPSGWVRYPVQPGDNLYRISQAYGITVSQLQAANCLGSSTLIVVGQWLFVPPWAPRTPTPTPFYLPTDTPWSFVPDTATPYPTDLPTATDTPTPVP